MINKKLLSFAPGALRYVGVNVAFQWMGLLWNVIFVRAVARLVGAVFAGTLTSRLLWQNLALCLCSIPFRFVFTMLSSRMSHEASKDVKGTLRSRIYQKLVALGENYTETVATSEVVMLASEGVARAFLHDAPFCCWMSLPPIWTASTRASSSVPSAASAGTKRCCWCPTAGPPWRRQT